MQIFTWTILITNGFSVFLAGSWDTATFVTSYLPIALFFILLAGHKIFVRSKWVNYDEMDFWTGNRVGIEEYEAPPKNFVEKRVTFPLHAKLKAQRSDYLSLSLCRAWRAIV